MPKFSELPKLGQVSGGDINGLEEVAILDDQIVKSATIDQIKNYVSANIDVSVSDGGGGGGNFTTLFTQPKQVIDSSVTTDVWTFLDIPSGFMFKPFEAIAVLNSVTANEQFSGVNPPGWNDKPLVSIIAKKKSDNSGVFQSTRQLESTIFFDEFINELGPRGALSASGYKISSSWKLFAFSNWGIQPVQPSATEDNIMLFEDKRLGTGGGGTDKFVARSADIDIIRFTNPTNGDSTEEQDNFIQRPTFFDDIRIEANFTKGTVDGTNLQQAELSFGITGQLIPNPLV